MAPVARPLDGGEIGVGGLAIVEVGPDHIMRQGEAPVEIAKNNERMWPMGGMINPSLKNRDLCQQFGTVLRVRRGVVDTATFQRDGHQLDRVAIVGEIDPRAVTQAAIPARIERGKVCLLRDHEPALEGKTGVLLAVEPPSGTV